jgi:hypothetical protein
MNESLELMSDRDAPPDSPEIKMFRTLCLADQLFALQPMSEPVGRIFYLDIVTSRPPEILTHE